MNVPEEIRRYSAADLAGVIAATAPDRRHAPAAEDRKAAPRNPDEAGGRNNYFTSRAGKLRRLGVGPEGILASLREENSAKGYEMPDRELATIARSVGGYDVPEEGAAGDIAALEGNIRRGIHNMGLRIDAVGRIRHIQTGNVSKLTTPLLGTMLWRDLRKIGKASAEDIDRLLTIEVYEAAERERARIAGLILGRPESVDALEALRAFLKAITGRDDNAETAAMLQFMWLVKRSMAGRMREHDIMPILYNQIQGNGKSTAVRRLVSPFEEMVDSVTAETLSDERKRADLGRFAIGVWDEMEGADKRDTDAIKSTLSSQTVSYRPMRTNDNQTVVRTMNFIGTSNKPLAGLIRDSSGNRRFVEIQTLPKLDHDIINGLDYPLLWQAVSENASAPAKGFLGEIQTRQSEGRYQDSVALWLESVDFAKTGTVVPCESFRAEYVAWCQRMGDAPFQTSTFNTRLGAEGFKKARRRVGTNPTWVFIVPDSRIVPSTTPPDDGPRGGVPNQEGAFQIDGTADGTLNQGIDMKIDQPFHRSIEKSCSQENGIFPQTSKGLERWNGGTPPTPTPPWPVPPSPGTDLWVYDIEVFPNRFMFSAFNGTEWREYDELSFPAMVDFVRTRGVVLAGFNNHGYDDVIVGALAHDPRMRNPKAIYDLSCRIIEPQTEADKDANFKDRYKNRPWAYSIDVFQLLNGKGALKEWECRIGFQTIVESPAAFDKALPEDQADAVRQYCRNDVLATAQILVDRWELVRLRTMLASQFSLGARAYVLSEQGLAQATFLTLHRGRPKGGNTAKVRAAADAAPENASDRLPLAELVSPRVKFDTDEGRELWERLKAGATLVKADSWAIELDGQPLPESFPFGGVSVSLGVGGLHTVDKPGTISATDDEAIVDLDVTSYYPSLMIAERIFPSQIGDEFVADLETLRAQRVAAKKAGDKTTSEALKIVLNATFGKLNDKWSPIRSVRNAFRVTINGQLYLLMLIERLADAGFVILSANTDGVTIQASRSRLAKELAAVVSRWQSDTAMELEQTLFSRISRRDVNTYVAATEDGKVKLKGDLNPDGGKADGQAITRAAVAYMLHGTDPATSIAAETDPRAFLFYQRCKNGGTLCVGDETIGKTVRWYVTKGGKTLKRRNIDGTFATIPNGHHVALALDITGWTNATLADLDTAYYVTAAWDLIRTTAEAAD